MPKFHSLENQIERIKYYNAKYGDPSSQQAYGMGYWLKRYLDIPDFIPLYACIDHGALIRFPPMSQLDTNQPILVTSSLSQKILIEKYNKKSYLCGAPFVYCRKINKIEKKKNAKGTVVFPAHSTARLKQVNDWEVYAKQLLKLPKRFHPIIVCLYWQDILQDVHNLFLKHGFEIVTAGHSADIGFALNFYNIIKNFRYATSNLLGSYTLYTIEMGIPFFLYGNEPLFHNIGLDPNCPELFTESNDIPSFGIQKRDFKYNLQKPIKISSTLRNICSILLGIDQPINKKELRKVIYLSLLKNGPKMFMNKFISYIYGRR